MATGIGRFSFFPFTRRNAASSSDTAEERVGERKRALKAWAAAAVGAFLTRRPLPVEIAPIGLHEARHGYVSIMHDAGFSLERIGDYVGHSSAFMVDRYRHLLDGHEQEAADILSAYLASRAGTQSGTRPITAPLEPALLSQN